MSISVHYFVHDVDGKILRMGVCNTRSLAAQADVGEFVRQGVAEAGQYFDMEQMRLKSAPPAPEDVMRNIRETRRKLLSACDWTQLQDVPLATQKKWAAYRQALRDMTKQTPPVVWPKEPK